MGLVSRLQAASPVGPNPRDSWIREPFFAASSHSGKTVTVDKAMQFDAVWACIRLKSYTAGQMPIRIYERLTEDESRPAPNQRVGRVLRRPNGEHVRFNLWQLAEAHLNSWGDAFLGKRFDSLGEVRELWPIRPDLVRVSRENGVKLFFVKDADTGLEHPEPFTSNEIVHVMGFSLDGLRGLSPIGMAREAIGAGLAMDHHWNSFYKNGAVPPLVLTSDLPLDAEGRKRVRQDWNRVARGVSKRWNTVILEQGLKPMPLSLPMKDVEFVATADHGLQKICRWFGVWPSMIGAPSGDSLTYKTLEGEALRHLMFTMNPELSLIEQSLEADPDLFPMRPGDLEPRFFPEFARGKFLQADALTEAQVFKTATGGRAWMLPSEVRKIKNLPPDDSIDDPGQNPHRTSPDPAAGDGPK